MQPKNKSHLLPRAYKQCLHWAIRVQEKEILITICDTARILQSRLLEYSQNPRRHTELTTEQKA